MERPSVAFPRAGFFSTCGTVAHTPIVLDVGPLRLNDRNTTFTAHQASSLRFG